MIKSWPWSPDDAAFVTAVARVLAMAAVFVFFAALGSLEARITTTLLSTVVGMAPGSASAASRR